MVNKLLISKQIQFIAKTRNNKTWKGTKDLETDWLNKKKRVDNISYKTMIPIQIQTTISGYFFRYLEKEIQDKSKATYGLNISWDRYVDN